METNGITPNGTDRLREFLDEQNIEYDAYSDFVTIWGDKAPRFIASEGFDGRLLVTMSLMPEQIIKAMIALGVCKDEEYGQEA